MSGLLSHPQSRNRTLRELLRTATPVLAPGSHDALYMGGFATTASLLGRPDVGLLNGNQMIDNATRIVDTVTIPVIADADTGYGNALNVVTTVRAYERAGISAIHLEDQVAPKRCGHMAGKQVISADEMVGKIKAAADARIDPDFVLIARTDALAVEGMDAAIDRVLRYAEAGADVLWVEAPTTEAELQEIMRRLAEKTVLLNALEGGRTPMISAEKIRELGFALVLYPIGSVLARMAALREHYADIRKNGTPVNRLDKLPSFDDFTQAVGVKEIEALEKRFSAEANASPSRD